MSAKDDAAVRRAYLRRIQGYDVTETKTEYRITEEGDEVPVKKTESTKHVPGDVRAAEFWLINRQSETWKPARLLGYKEAAEGGEEAGVIQIPAVEEDDDG